MPLSFGNAKPHEMQVSAQLCQIPPALLVCDFTEPTWQIALADLYGFISVFARKPLGI